ncbi:MAG TPA: Xaa-Pro peptidase family protein [Mycobacteriales bacterium]|jgi:Xaa-Pro aminopeptidase|nr:Xaa-Pro peptidase family protein [Mycobacteriales bacterium]
MLPHEQRRTRLIASFPDTIDAILVTRIVNVRYLTGFTGSNGAVLIRRTGEPLMATDGRYLTQVAAEAPELEILDARAVAPAMVERTRSLGVGRLGIEAGDVTLELNEVLTDVAGDALSLVATDGMVERLRSIKDAGEVEALARACEITDAGFGEILPRLRPGVSETDVAWWLHGSMREHGAEGLAFDTIVAFGPHSAIPHHRPSDRTLEAGDLVKLDFGARYDGYHADMTRTVVISPAAEWQRDLHAVVRQIQQDCREATVIGASPRDLDQLARDSIEGSGHQAAHGLGHGVGLEVHELPFLSVQSSADRLVDRVPVTVEPGVYLPGRGGVRIEDTVIVGADGARSLTTSSRELIEIS